MAPWAKHESGRSIDRSQSRGWLNRVRNLLLQIVGTGPRCGNGGLAAHGASTRDLLEPERRFELLTCALRVRCSTD
jgi:hypothetical protein